MVDEIIKPARFSFPAPAKINLCLKVLGQEADSYHSLQTVFHFLDFSDTLHFTARTDQQVNLMCRWPHAEMNLPQEQNLVFKAVNLLSSYAQEQGLGIEHRGVDIELEKRLPMGGGLGGGSSNAATTLLVLNQFWKLFLNIDTLAQLGLRLGADVPVFIRGKSALAEGRGERLSPIKIAEFYYVLIKPRCHVATAEIFQHQDLTRDSSPRTIRAFLTGGQGFQGLEKLIEIGNDCQQLVRELYPEVDSALNALGQFSKPQLTGTGACVFAPFETQASANQALRFLRASSAGKQWFEEAYLVKGINESPLHADLKQINWGVAKR